MIYFVRFLSSAAWSCFYPFMAIWLNSAVGLSTSAAGIVVGKFGAATVTVDELR